MNGYPERRMRRLRRTPALRRLFDMDMPNPGRFLWPVFVTEGRGVRQAIPSLPNQFRYSADELIAALEPLVVDGLGGLMVFAVVESAAKDDTGRQSARPDGLVPRAVRAVKARFPDLTVFTDVCLCAYTRHGHCGPLDANGEADNDAALALLAGQAVAHAAAGADGVAPSAMMDGQVRAIRSALDGAGHAQTLIMSYSTKFASAFYGPFRDAADSAPSAGDRRGYQASFADPRRALMESALDEAEGADILMVKPALCYLDILAELRRRTDLPLAAFNVSGEYAMIAAAGERGWGDAAAMAREALVAIRRAGADIVISYWAARYRELFPSADFSGCGRSQPWEKTA